MNNIWYCPHIEFIEINEEVELNDKRQRIINVLSNHINKLVMPQEPKHRTRASKNESLQKLARSSRHTSKEQTDPKEVQVVQLSNNLSITVCNACYLALREDIVVEILKGIRDGR